MPNKLKRTGIRSKRITSRDKFLKGIHQKNRRVLEKSLFELTAAYNIGREASYAADLQNCLKVLVDGIADLMSVEIVSVMLMDRYEEGLVLEFARGLGNEITKEKVRLGQGVAGWIAQTGKALLIKDIKRDSRFSRRGGKYYTDSLLSVPLKINKKVIGVINVNNKVTKDIFEEDDMDVLNKVAGLAAAAIESARLQEEAMARDETRLEFISNVSHELRTPLSCINEGVSLVLDGVTGRINSKQKKFLAAAKNNIERLKRLVNELLELARVESRITRMRRSLFDVVGLIEGVVASMGPLLKDKKISLKKTLPDKEIYIWADPDKLSQVLTNLIDNAMKYNRPKGTVEVSMDELAKAVNINILDTGIGISEEDIKKIFDRFYRVETPTKGKASGAGIGLSIINEIIKKHRGKISVDSLVGRGSRFTVTLPKDLRAENR